MKTIDLTNGENSQCNTYDMGAEISVDKRRLAERDCQFVYFRTEFNYQKILHETTGDVTPNKDQLPVLVLQQSWKRKNSPGAPKNINYSLHYMGL